MFIMSASQRSKEGTHLYDGLSDELPKDSGKDVDNVRPNEIDEKQRETNEYFRNDDQRSHQSDEQFRRDEDDGADGKPQQQNG